MNESVVGVARLTDKRCSSAGRLCTWCGHWDDAGLTQAARNTHNPWVDLLCLIRFTPAGDDPLPAWEAAEFFAAALPDAGGTQIHREDLQAMVLFQDAALALQLLSDTMNAGQAEKFSISAGLAQGIQSSATIASSLSGFTEGSLETLFEVAAAAGQQQVAISARLSSIIELSAPEYAQRFVAIENDRQSRIRQPLIMGPST